MRYTGKCFKASVEQDREGFVVKEEERASDEEIDDEYLPACCRNGKPHSHPV
jgi:hypothetical protein